MSYQATSVPDSVDGESEYVDEGPEEDEAVKPVASAFDHIKESYPLSQKTRSRTKPNGVVYHQSFTSRNRLLIAGTPLQNNLKELFALLNIICPKIFVHYEDLNSLIHKDNRGVEGEEATSKIVIEALHKILGPFLLRRVSVSSSSAPCPNGRNIIYRRSFALFFAFSWAVALASDIAVG